MWMWFSDFCGVGAVSHVIIFCGEVTKKNGWLRFAAPRARGHERRRRRAAAAVVHTHNHGPSRPRSLLFLFLSFPSSLNTTAKNDDSFGQLLVTDC